MSFVNKYITPYLGTAAVVVVVYILIKKFGSKVPVIGSWLS